MRLTATTLGSAAAAAAIAITLALSGTAVAGGPGWLAGPNGCKVWNWTIQPRRTFTWSGGCEDGLVSGNGVLQWYENGVPSDRYQGEYRAGHMSGHGIYQAADGERFDGTFKDDARTGRGTYITLRGDRYEGDFQRSVLQGKGEAVFTNGDRYEGGFWNNRAHGEGTLRKADGTVVSGNWINGCLRRGERRYAVGVGTDAAKCP